MSHEGVIYCKPHHKELFQPKAVIMDILDDKRDAKAKKTQDIIGNCLYNFRINPKRRFESKLILIVSCFEWNFRFSQGAREKNGDHSSRK